MKRKASAICLIAILALVSTSVTSSKTPTQPEQSESESSLDFVRGRMLVKFRSEILPDHARQIIAGLGARDAGQIPGIGVHIVDLPSEASEKAFVNAFQGRAEVEFAELDQLVAPELVPNDFWYAGGQWHLPKISAPSAWEVTTGSDSITVAILDTGVDTTHEDLAGKVVPGRNIYDNNSDTSDVNGHGTNVAGVVGAQSNNSIGVASVAWGCRIMPIRVTDTAGYGSYSAIASGLTWAADHGARVANISFIVSNSSVVKTAAQYFQDRGGVVASSAGNYNTFDAAADNPYILTVSATNTNDMRSDFSNYGNNVDVAAPEGGYTTARGGGYTYAGGTSFASPVVAGVAALILSANPTLSGAQVQNLLKQNADDLGTQGWDMYYGSGRVNAARAVSAATGGGDSTRPNISFVSPGNGSTVSGSVVIQATASDNVGVASVTFSIDGGPSTLDSSSPYSMTWNSSNVINGLHTVTATAVDAAGNSSSSTITVTVSNSTPPPDTIAPVVSITSPAQGSKVPANVSVSVVASDNVGVVRTELYVDGALVATTTAAPFTTKWNTKKASTGTHRLQCRSFDAAGNVGLSQEVTVYK